MTLTYWLLGVPGNLEELLRVAKKSGEKNLVFTTGLEREEDVGMTAGFDKYIAKFFLHMKNKDESTSTKVARYSRMIAPYIVPKDYNNYVAFLMDERDKLFQKLKQRGFNVEDKSDLQTLVNG